MTGIMNQKRQTDSIWRNAEPPEPVRRWLITVETEILKLPARPGTVNAVNLRGSLVFPRWPQAV